MISFKRAAAKIELDIIKANITGYTPASARARIINYLDKTKIGSEFQFEGEANNENDFLSKSVALKPNNDTSNSFYMEDPFYTYSNDWTYNIDKETYLMLEVDWTNQSTQNTQTYYYRLPFSYIQQSAVIDKHRFRINRNYIYHFLVDVGVLGGLEPEAAI
ncbi:MAG: hypothetical protein ACRDD8_07655, partial [Bacteroidales bacterium]